VEGVTDGESEGDDCDEVICGAQDEVNQEESELNRMRLTE